MVSEGRPAGTRFLVLLGIDGSGKTTVLSGLSVPGLVTASWRDLRSHQVPAMLAPDSPTEIKRRIPRLSRAMFIGGHLVAQYEYLVRPALEDGADVLLDSYYFKLLVKERLFGTVHPALEELCSELPPPDGVVYVEVPAVESYRRKRGRLSPYEYRATASQADYVAFQKDLASGMKALLAGIPTIFIDGSAEPEALAAQASQAVERLVGSAQAGDLVAQR